jgi:predicted amidohydrolase YtcJ
MTSRFLMVRGLGCRAARAVVASIALTMTACSGSPGGAQSGVAGGSADLIITNGRVYTADGQGTIAEALAIQGNRITHVGRADAIEARRGPQTEVIDAHGATVLPGLIDSHVHFLMGAETLDQMSLRNVRTAADVQQRIREYVAANPGRSWIRGWGYFSGITRQDLDVATGETPALFIAGDGHSMLANTKALTLAGITKTTPNPEGGEIVRDRKTGEATGVLLETAQALLSAVLPAPTAAEQRRLIAKGTEEAHKAGVTTIVNVGGSDELEAYDGARAAGELKLRIHSALWLKQDNADAALPKTFAFTEADADRFETFRRKYAEDDLFRTGIVKIMLDGVIESHTAAMLEPYTNRPSTSGHANYSQEELNRVIAMMDRRGWQVMTHALGDRAVRMALDAYEHANAVNSAPARGRRHKIEHIESIDPVEVPRFAKLGIIASLQPSHAGGMNNPKRTPTRWANIGYERSAWGFPWKSIRDAGGRLAFGSDWPVASLNPGRGMFVALHRMPNPPIPDQALTMGEVIDAYTRDGAYTIFEDERRGRLAPGTLADVVVLASDVFARPAESAGDLVVDTTIFDGKVVYRRAPMATDAAR